MKNRIFYIINSVFYFLLLIVFVYLSLEDGNESTNTSNFVVNILVSIISFFKKETYVPSELFLLLVRKIFGHFLYFLFIGITSFFFYNGFKIKYHNKLLFHFISGFIFALFTEFILQNISINRGPSLYDVLIDYLGFLSISIILSFIVYKRQK